MSGAAASQRGYRARRLEGRVDLLQLHRLVPERYPYLLESAAQHPRSARWSILPAEPRTCGEGAQAVLRALGGPWPSAHPIGGAPPHLPFVGGWFIYLGYEVNAAVEPGLPRHASPGLADARLAYCPGAVVVDHLEGCTWLVVGGEDPDVTLLDRLERDLRRLERPVPQRACPPFLRHWREDPPEAYLEGVQRILHYIREGDVFQVNLSRAWRGESEGLDPAALYARLRRANPAPFAALATWKDGAVISSSPERLIYSDGERLETRPIAGTLPREVGEDPDRRLLGDPKERAEHIMLIDLERNDLGRVCRPGTVEVDELMTIESYAHVHHIVSNVRGRLRPGTTPAEAIAAVFPGGTITGCPKVRCMEIIHDLEGEGRGPYTGSLGYLSFHGRMDLNILIRSFAYDGDERGGRLVLRAGAGIVADSRPERELDETRAKALGLLRALEV